MMMVSSGIYSGLWETISHKTIYRTNSYLVQNMCGEIFRLDIKFPIAWKLPYFMKMRKYDEQNEVENNNKLLNVSKS